MIFNGYRVEVMDISARRGNHFAVTLKIADRSEREPWVRVLKSSGDDYESIQSAFSAYQAGLIKAEK